MFLFSCEPVLVQHEKRYRMKRVNNDLLVTSLTIDEVCFLATKSMCPYILFEFMC